VEETGAPGENNRPVTIQVTIASFQLRNINMPRAKLKKIDINNDLHKNMYY
jgi:hypothetical protein